jgi:phosphatidylinositol alpha-1,6-mannosyltransferase
VTRTLIVTNDFPPRPGGIQAFVHNLAVRQPPGSLVVYAPAWKGAASFDAEQPFEVVRHPTSLMLPVPEVARSATDIALANACDTVWFGAAAPLGLLAGHLRRHARIRRIVAQTHGHEVGWAALPGARSMLRRIARGADVVTYLGDYTRSRLAPVIDQLSTMEHLPPGVDPVVFRPDADGEAVRHSLRLAGRPLIVCVSRLVPRKGQDMLIRALPEIRRRVPGAALLIVSGGPDQPRLQRLAVHHDVASDVVFTGAVPWEELPSYYAAGDVFAMPCRTRRGGLDVEGLGIVFLEASATGLPVVAGDSGGAPDAVRDGETGFVVDGRSTEQIVDRISTLLLDRALAHQMGQAGRRWVEAEWTWDALAARMTRLLCLA